MSSLRMLNQGDEPDDSADFSWDDQQRINSFSRLNARYRKIKESVDQLKQEKEALNDLSTELELADEDDPVLYKVGEIFIHLSLPQALRRLEQDVAAVNAELSSLATSSDDCEKEMQALKTVLYAKFGRAINLDE